MKGKRNRKVLAIAVAAIAAVLALCLTLGFTVPLKTLDILVFQGTEDSVTLVVRNYTPTQEDSLGLQVDGGETVEYMTVWLSGQGEDPMDRYKQPDGSTNLSGLWQEYGQDTVRVSAPILGDSVIFHDTVELKDKDYGEVVTQHVIVKNNLQFHMGGTCGDSCEFV